MLSIDELDAGYGQTQVLHRVSISVGEGEIVAVIGANGAGKTTMLRAAAGLIATRHGSVTFAGRSLRRQPPEARARLGLGYVPEGRGILGRLTVGENLRLGTAALPSRRGWQNTQAEVLDLFPNLAGRLGDRASALSGGQQQMLAIGRALMSRPRLLMIDELSLGLAPLVTGQIMQALQQLRKHGRTFLLVEQDAAVLRASDRTYVLARGRVALEDRSADLIEQGRERLAAVYFSQRTPSRQHLADHERKVP